jgi:hypothetical protein
MTSSSTPPTVEALIALWEGGDPLAAQRAEVRGLGRELIAAIAQAVAAGLPIETARPQQDRLTAAWRTLNALQEARDPARAR